MDVALIVERHISMYLYEIHLHCHFIKQNAEAIFRKFDDKFTGMIVDPEIIYFSSAICTDAGKLRNLIKNTRERNRKLESFLQHKIRLERNKLTENLFRGIDITPLVNNDSRNSIEHVDEYIDNLLYRIADSKDHLHLAAQNIAITHDDILTGRHPIAKWHEIRIYISSTGEFHHCGKKTNIKQVYNCAKEILKLVEDQGIEGSGAIYPLKPGDFQVNANT